jgi:ribonuclease P protein component
MTDPGDFRGTIRRGSRAGNRQVVVHCRTDEESTGSLVGFVVPKREIPLATDRNRVKRQLRHLMRARVDALPDGARVVIRVQREARDRTSSELDRSLESALDRAWARWAR